MWLGTESMITHFSESSTTLDRITKVLEFLIIHQMFTVQGINCYLPDVSVLFNVNASAESESFVSGF